MKSQPRSEFLEVLRAYCKHCPGVRWRTTDLAKKLEVNSSTASRMITEGCSETQTLTTAKRLGLSLAWCRAPDGLPIKSDGKPWSPFECDWLLRESMNPHTKLAFAALQRIIVPRLLAEAQPRDAVFAIQQTAKALDPEAFFKLANDHLP